MNAHYQLTVAAELKQLRPLVGGVITHLLEDKESFGFVVRLPNGKNVSVWVDMDPEGNGPGHLELVQQFVSAST